MDYLQTQRKQFKRSKELRFKLRLVEITVIFIVGVLIINGLMFFY